MWPCFAAATSRSPPWSGSFPASSARIRMRPSCAASLDWAWCWGRGVLGEFGDDPDRYQTAKGRKAFAGTAPVTRSSGLRTVVVARAACNQRLVDACYLWAFAAPDRLAGGAALLRHPPGPRHQPSPGTTGAREPAGRDLARLPGPPGRLPRADRLAGRRTGGLSTEVGGAPGLHPPGDTGHSGRPGGRRCRWGSDAARSSAMGRPGLAAVGLRRRRRWHHPAGEFGRTPRSRLTAGHDCCPRRGAWPMIDSKRVESAACGSRL